MNYHQRIVEGWYHTVGLKSDGTVVAIEFEVNNFGQCDVGGWDLH